MLREAIHGAIRNARRIRAKRELAELVGLFREAGDQIEHWLARYDDLRNEIEDLKVHIRALEGQGEVGALIGGNSD